MNFTAEPLKSLRCELHQRPGRQGCGVDGHLRVQAVDLIDNHRIIAGYRSGLFWQQQLSGSVH